MSRMLAVVLVVLVWLGVASPAIAINQTLVPCGDSPTFQARMQAAPDTYYFNEPFETYSSELLCGPDGLPHLPLDRFERAIDVVIPIAIFLYVAGFIGWSGRAYLQMANKARFPEQLEIFIDIPLALRSLAQGLLWPVLVIKEFLSGDLIAPDQDIPVSPR